MPRLKSVMGPSMVLTHIDDNWESTSLHLPTATFTLTDGDKTCKVEHNDEAALWHFYKDAEGTHYEVIASGSYYAALVHVEKLLGISERSQRR